MLRRPSSIAGALASLALLASLLRSVAIEEAVSAAAYEDVYYVPPPEWLVLISLGHREALADLLWCRSLVYQGDEFAHRGTLAHLFDYATAMTALDPDFRAVYVWIGTAGVYQPNEVTLDEIRRSIEFLEHGRERFPDDGELAWILGATYTFEIPPFLPEEERDDSRLRGLEHLMDAVRMGAAPEWLVLSNTSQLSRLGRAERAVEHLEEMYATVSDETIRAEIGMRIEEVRSEAYGRAFIDINDAFEAERLRHYPYVAPSFYFLIARSSEEADGLGTLRHGYGRELVEELTLDVGQTDQDL